MAARIPVDPAPPLPTRAQFDAWAQEQIALNPGFVVPDQLCQEDIKAWEEVKATLDKAKAMESALRSRIVRGLFNQIREGTNKAALPTGDVVTVTHPITRKVIEIALEPLKRLTVAEVRQWLQSLNVDSSAMPDNMLLSEAMKLKLDDLIEWKPELKVAEYRKLTAEQMCIFDTCLEIKPGSDQVKIAGPKE